MTHALQARPTLGRSRSMPQTRRRFLLATTSALATPVLSAAKPAYRVAVIGHTGKGNYGHGLDTMWLKLPSTTIVAVADADPSGLTEAKSRLNVSEGFADYRVMLEKTRPDIVVIGPRQIDQHHAMCLAAAASGARGIYIEKPFCRSPKEADEIIAACANNKTKLAIAHRNRYHPALATCKRLLDEGAIGRLLEARARGKEDQRGGTLDLWVLGCHLFNLAEYFMGAPRFCSAQIYQNGAPCTREHVIEGAEGIGALAGNEAHARFEMANGLPLFFDSVQNAGRKETGFGLQLIGNEGIIDLRIDMEPLAHLRKGSPFDPRSASQPWEVVTSAGLGGKEPIADLKSHVGGHLAAAEDLFAAIAEDRPPLCGAEAGRTSIEMICAVLESHRLGGKRVALPLETRVNPLSLL